MFNTARTSEAPLFDKPKKFDQPAKSPAKCAVDQEGGAQTPPFIQRKSAAVRGGKLNAVLQKLASGSAASASSPSTPNQ